MSPETVETRAHTTREGMLNLSVQVGVFDTDVAVTVQVRPVARAAEMDGNGWPKGFFEQVAGSMPELRRGPQGNFATRLPLAFDRNA